MHAEIFLCISCFILFGLNIANSEQCPPASLISPCTCGLNAAQIVTTCKNINSTETLVEIFNRSHEWPMYGFTLQNSNGMFFPSAALTTKKIVVIKIINTTMTSLFDEPPSQGNYLEQLSLIGARLQRGVQWEYFRNLGHLIFLEIQDISIKKLNRVFKESISEKLLILKLSHTKTTSLEDTAFQRLEKLKELHLRYGGVSFLKRSMFSNPCALNTLDLTGNRIESLPSDVFQNMPNLLRVHIAENKLTTISSTVFGLISTREHHFIMAYDNPLLCDCKMKWVTHLMQTGWILGRCSGPEDKKDKHIDELKPEDFPFCPRI